MKHANNGTCQACAETLKNVADHLREWFEGEQLANPNLHCSTGYRGEIEQNAAANRGASKAKFGQGAHNYKPAMAVDVYHRDDKGSATWPSDLFQDLADRKPDDIEWGADWNDNGRSDDETFIDKPHFQIKGWKKLVKNYPNGNK